MSDFLLFSSLPFHRDKISGSLLRYSRTVSLYLHSRGCAKNRIMKFSSWLLLAGLLVVFSQQAINCYPSECVLPFPRSYVVYHLDEQESIDVDGKLDDKAWNRVSRTEDFIGKHLFY